MKLISRIVFPLALSVAITTGCRTSDTVLAEGATSVTVADWNSMPDGRKIRKFTLRNSGGMTAEIIELGAIMTSLTVPDRDGNMADVLLACETPEGFLNESPYFGAVVGRYANRIARGRFTLDGTEYKLATNDGANHLHGGAVGYDKVLWSGEPFQEEGRCGVRFSYTSPDGEEGYPGTLQIQSTYILTNDNTIEFIHEAVTDRKTVVNLTQHNYWNLSGHASGTILNHELMINASNYTPGDDTLIPTGAISPVAGTPLDFREYEVIGSRIAQVPGGYDHNYVLNREGKGLTLAARVHDPASGRVMEIRTTEPGLQFYTGNFLDGSIKSAKGGADYAKHAGFCLESQKYPDTPNKPGFPSAVLMPGEKYMHHTVHSFSAK